MSCGAAPQGLLRVMEILELPRGAAAELLASHGWSVEAAVLSVLG